MKLLLDYRELAEALALAPETVRQYAHKHPEKLPPRVKTQLSKHLWAVKDVEAWVEQARAASQQALVE